MSGGPAIESNNRLLRSARWRLTILYAGLLAVVLAVFAGIVALLLYMEIERSHREEMTALLDRYQAVAVSALADGGRRGSIGPGAQPPSNGGEFVAALAPDGSPIVLLEAGPWWRDGLLDALRSWNGAQAMERRLEVEGARDADVQFMGAARPLTDASGRIGTLVGAVDMSPEFRLERHLLLLLAGVGGFFLLAAAGIGHAMSKRAMVPIASMFDRQKRFLSDASHELRTPVSVMLASLELLEMTEAGRMPPDSRETLEALKMESLRMKALIEAMLAMARSEEGIDAFARRPFDLSGTADACVQAMRPIAADKRIRLSLQIEPGEYRIVGDGEKVAQALFALLDNALKYTPPNGAVSVELRNADGSFELDVADSGPGIREGEEDKLFARGFRGEAARRAGGQGSGIGLTIAKWIAEGHGGSIRTVPGQDAGARFRIRLPHAPLDER